MTDLPDFNTNDAVKWMQDRMFLNFDSFEIRADRFGFGQTVYLRHRIYPYGKLHECYAPTLREALSNARRALHAWAQDSVKPRRQHDPTWPMPAHPGGRPVGDPGTSLESPKSEAT